MKTTNIKVLVIEDDILKAIDINRALKSNNIKNITKVNNQEEAWRLINEQGEKFDLIVTDMHYPLAPGALADKEAGLKLIKRLEQEGSDTPIIVCSSVNYSIPGILGSVWYNKLRDLDSDFEKLLNK